MVSPERLRIKNIQCGVPDLPGPQSLNKRCFFDQRATRCVDEDRTPFHPRQSPRIQEPVCLWNKCEMQTDSIRNAQKVVEISRFGRNAWRNPGPVPGNDAHAKGPSNPGHFSAYTTQPKEAERPSLELDAFPC